MSATAATHTLQIHYIHLGDHTTFTELYDDYIILILLI